MCYHQNVHAAFHYELLSVDARERERHDCLFQCPKANARTAGGRCAGKKCSLHSCCWVSKVVVIRCRGVVAREKEGGYEGDDGQVCSRLFVEDVFVPLPDRGNDDFWDVDACPSETSAGQLWGEASKPILEFWPEDGAPRLVFPDEIVSEGDYRLASLHEPAVGKVEWYSPGLSRGLGGTDRGGWAWGCLSFLFPCLGWNK
ncbi:hypothetical protein F4859DRAFT_332454 [Xylaria cf. heliscus]|nr:hypothetical protein F4859DRAFT_332454 [Xylaria cf. heliscus]